MAEEYNRGQDARSERLPRQKLPDLRRTLAERVLVLDGATGTELERRGIDCALPLWSTHALLVAPESVAAIHSDYVDAGADILTANTFRTQRRTLRTAGLADRAAELTARAVELARRAAQTGAGDGPAVHSEPPRPVWVAGSCPTLEDCYRPDLVPDTGSLEREHAEHCEALAAAGADLILVETMNTVREARAAAAAASATGLPFLVSFVSWRNATLLSGEALSSAVAAVAPLAPAALLVNCLPPSAVSPLLGLLEASGLPFGAYPNLGAPGGAPGAPRREDRSPEALAELAHSWLDAGARIVGGCCGTQPEHVRALASLARVRRRSG